MGFDTNKNNGGTKEGSAVSLIKAPDNFETMFKGCPTLDKLPEGFSAENIRWMTNRECCYTLNELPEGFMEDYKEQIGSSVTL